MKASEAASLSMKSMELTKEDINNIEYINSVIKKDAEDGDTRSIISVGIRGFYKQGNNIERIKSHFSSNGYTATFDGSYLVLSWEGSIHPNKDLGWKERAKSLRDERDRLFNQNKTLRHVAEQAIRVAIACKVNGRMPIAMTVLKNNAEKALKNE